MMINMMQTDFDILGTVEEDPLEAERRIRALLDMWEMLAEVFEQSDEAMLRELAQSDSLEAARSLDRLATAVTAVADRISQLSIRLKH
jgi:hypothetical protein